MAEYEEVELQVIPRNRGNGSLIRAVFGHRAKAPVLIRDKTLRL